ncbi:hypothetical protein MUP95_07350 [bacterium]|nr:hypothetical protein [bacterium]
MIGYIILTFIIGGIFGMIGMAILAFGPKTSLLQENRVLKERLTFLESQDQKQYKPVKDPRPHVHTLVN